MSRILFIDRDGVLIEEPADEQVDSYAKFRLVAGVIPALLRLREAGFEFVMVTNQDGLGTPSFPTEAFEGPQALLLQVLGSQGIVFREVLVDPHFPADNAPTRKPGIGMVMHYLRDRSIDLAGSAMVGDRESDMEFARNLGVRGLRLGPGAYDWEAIAHELADAPRVGQVERNTRETRIRVRVDLDRSAEPVVATGLAFFDHMLEQLGKHGGFALDVHCAGDLHIDEHHTVEDCALALGSALRHFSGRPWLVFEGTFPREKVGDLPTELVPHFFRSLCDAAGLNLHLSVRGENAHHMVEACFKALARALRQALRREGSALPSTKGSL